MKKTILMLMAAAALGVSCTEKEPVLTPEQQNLQTKLVGAATGEREEGTLLIKLTEEAQKGIVEGLLNLGSIVTGIQSASVEPLFPSGRQENETAARYGLDRWYTVKFDKSTSLSAAAEKLASHDGVQSVEYNALVERTDSDISVEHTASIATKAAAASSLPFNDPELGIQWNLINTGDKSISATAVEGADVGVKDAWKLTAGDPRVVVAVFDQGIATRHPDLMDNLWVNPGEDSSTNGIDDDSNGYKDDINGYNFAEDKGRPSAKYGADHGTHIAGTIAATNNNGIGVSSIAGGTGVGDGVRLMSCQIFDQDGGKATGDMIAKAFKYAADHGASIAQCSYGEDGAEYDKMGRPIKDAYLSDSDYIGRNTAEYDALMYFLDPANCNCEALETNIVVFASGNYNKPSSLYPGALEGLISVTALGPDFLPGGYSNYGTGCDIAAPGGDIVEGDASAPCMILSTGYNSNGGLSYIYKYGTSMACPHVSGVVALGMSYALKIGKKFSREDFISRLLTSTNEIDSKLTGSTMKLMVSGNQYVSVDVFPKKGKMGTGAVDAWKFLMALEGTPTVMTSPGKQTVIDIAEYSGQILSSLDYKISIGEADRESLGIQGELVCDNGILTVTCTKTGSGKITVSGNDFSREISLVSRASVTDNGGWL